MTTVKAYRSILIYFRTCNNVKKKKLHVYKQIRYLATICVFNHVIYH
jgi:hypothetical protein